MVPFRPVLTSQFECWRNRDGGLTPMLWEFPEAKFPSRGHFQITYFGRTMDMELH